MVTNRSKKFPWYDLMCTPCLERLRVADFARDAHGVANVPLHSLLCQPCLAAFEEWATSPEATGWNNCHCDEEY